MSIQTYPAQFAETATMLRSGEIDSLDYLYQFCDRIDKIDHELRSFVSEPNRRDRLHDNALELRDRFPDQTDRPPLFGIPVGVKDIIHVDSFETRAGTALPPELFAGPEASCVTRLRDAGSLILGKTVTTEFAGLAPGLTRNPHELGHTPGGSSSGSAAAVAAGLCPLALGTQTGGSVIRPAAFCGIVGMKPSFERIPRDGVIERSKSADHVGMFTQSVAGMQIAASVLCDNWSSEESVMDSYPTIGVPRGEYLEKASPEAQDAFESQLLRLENAGCTVKEVKVPTFAEFDALDQRHQQLIKAELTFVHQKWFDGYEAFYRTPTAKMIKSGRKVTAGQLAESRNSQIELREELEALLEDHGLDLWAAPAATGPAPETIQTTGNPIMNRPWTHSGLPVVTLPAGKTEDGLPLGVQFVASFMADEQLLAWAEMLADAL